MDSGRRGRGQRQRDHGGHHFNGISVITAAYASTSDLAPICRISRWPTW